jgi:hypothetical protein
LRRAASSPERQTTRRQDELSALQREIAALRGENQKLRTENAALQEALRGSRKKAAPRRDQFAQYLWSTPRRRLIPLSQVDQYLGLAGGIRNGAAFDFFGRS